MNDSNISTPPPETEENPGLRYLEPASLLFFRHGNTLRLTVADEFSLFRACVVRAFPLSRATSYISVLDGSGREVGLHDSSSEPSPGRLIIADVEGNRYEIPAVSRLDPASRRFLANHL
jgi:hypothetical protein